MRVVAPKTKQRKESPAGPDSVMMMKRKVTDGDEDGVVQPRIHHQPPTIPMTSVANKETTKQQPENLRQLTGLSFPKSSDPTQISNFERDSLATESTSSKNLDFSSLLKLKSSRNPRVSILEVLNDLKENNLDTPDPISKECTSSMTLPITEKSEKSPMVANRQQLVDYKENSVTTEMKGKTLTDMDNNNSNEDNSNMDMEMENISKYTVELPGQKGTSLRSWTRILRSSNFQIFVENLPKLQHTGKRPSIALSFLNSSIHKKQAICLDSSSVSQTFVGGNFPPPAST